MISSPSIPSSALSTPKTLHADSTALLSSSTPVNSIPLHSSNSEAQDIEDEIGFSSHDGVRFYTQVEDLEPQVSPQTDYPCTVSPILAESRPMDVSRPASRDPGERVKDDTEVRLQPSRCVDYLSHDWKVEDVWSSWKHIISKRSAYSKSARLENVLWRTWTKSKNKLKTVSPESINWLKDCDVTWLYGPLQTGSRISLRTPFSTPASRSLISEHNSFLDQKSILKKRSRSETMLQRSLSASSLVKQAAAGVQVQQLHAAGRGCDRPDMGPATSDYVASPCVSILASPGSGEEKRIHFDEQVKQCIALELKGYEDEGLDSYTILDNDNSDLDDEDVIMHRNCSKWGLPFLLNRKSAPAGNFCVDSITIAMLPSTRLKYREDTLPLQIMAKHNSAKLYLSGSPPSIFIPYEEDEGYVVSGGLFEKMVDAVNRVKDIAYVIWNVGWR